MKRVMIVSPRDFSLCTVVLKDKESGIVFTPFCTIDHPKFPETKAPIRATVHLGGWVLIPKEDGTTKTIYITEIDFSGNIPKGMIKMGADL